MLIDSVIFPTLMTPRRVGDTLSVQMGSMEVLHASVRRRWDAFKKLREIREGVLVLSDIVEGEGEAYFEVAPSAHYEAIKESVSRDLVWSTKRAQIDYAGTLERWCQMLEHDRVDAAWVDRVHANDLDAPEFGDIKITLMEYLISCQRKGNTYFRQSGFQAVRPSD